MKKEQLKMVLTSFAVMFVMVGSLVASEMDAKIVTSLQQSYVFKTFLKDCDIKIESKEGVVTLTGTASDAPSRLLAGETAAGMAAVVSVDNKLVLKDESTDENSDGWIHAKVKVMLYSHRNVSGGATQITVDKGLVTLRGEAESKAQKQLTSEYVKDIEGVKEVKNEMTVIEKPKSPPQTVSENIDDASITAQVKLSLLFHRGTRVLKTQVKTENGVVTVSGMAKNAAEKDLVNKLSADVHGVKEVKNMMTVAPATK